MGSLCFAEFGLDGFWGADAVFGVDEVVGVGDGIDEFEVPIDFGLVLVGVLGFIFEEFDGHLDENSEEVGLLYSLLIDGIILIFFR
jgi:hypothetical protein